MQKNLDHLFRRTSANGCFWKCSWNWEKLKIFDKGLFNIKNYLTSISETMKMYVFVFVSWLVFFGVCIYINISLRNKLQTINTYIIVDEKKIKSLRKECIDQWKTWKTISQWELDYVTCLQIYQELSSHTFFWVHSNSREVSYLLTK